MISTVLNKRYSLRNMSDEEFESNLPNLAKELEQVSFYPTYTNTELYDDWLKLRRWHTSNDFINSTSRIGMKLCEHFNHNFYDIENANGVSFKKLWTSNNLEKILRWNRKSHSTPYMSELKRGIYFCCGLPKSTMYRPQMMKLACIKYSPKVVLDPCAGWGGRMIGAVSSGARYIAFEPNTITYQNLDRMAEFLQIKDKVTLICDDARNMHKHDFENADMILTSPPYFDLEVYAHEDTQSITNTNTYQDWSNNFLQTIIVASIDRLNANGVSCWNVGKVRGHDMNKDIEKYHDDIKYMPIHVLSVASSKRQTNQTSTKNVKNNDNTVVYGEMK